MAYDRAFGEWVREHLAMLGPLEIKPMFGAASVYANGLIFALLDDGVIWLKADEGNEPALIAAGARQFTYPAKDGRLMAMAYWSLPEPGRQRRRSPASRRPRSQRSSPRRPARPRRASSPAQRA